jgi:hypothetical protein
MDLDRILRKIDINGLIGLVHRITNLVQQEPIISQGVFRVFGYSMRQMKLFVENVNAKLNRMVQDQDKEELIDFIKTLYAAPFIREIKAVLKNPGSRVWYEQLPEVANTNVVPVSPREIEMPVREAPLTFANENRPSFVKMRGFTRGGRRRVRKRKGTRGSALRLRR